MAWKCGSKVVPTRHAAAQGRSVAALHTVRRAVKRRPAAGELGRQRGADAQPIHRGGHDAARVPRALAAGVQPGQAQALQAVGVAVDAQRG